MAMHWLKGWLIVGISTATLGCASVSDPPTQTNAAISAPGALEVAQNALAEERYRYARNWFQKVLQADPHNKRAKLGLAETWLGDGLRQNAITLFDELVPSPAVGAEALQGKGVALLADGNKEAAQVALRAAVQRDASLWRAWNALGLLFDGKQDWAAATDAYAKATAAAPASAAPYNNWGVSLMTQKRYKEAAERFAQAIALAPGSEATTTNLRLALAFQGRYAEAMAGVQQEDVPDLLNNIGYVAMLRGEEDRAKAYFVRAMELSPNFHERAARNLQTLEGIESASVY